MRMTPRRSASSLHCEDQWRLSEAHQQTRVPEVQTTGDTTPVQQIVYAVSLTTSGGSNAKSGTECRKKGWGCGFSAVAVTGPVTRLSAFHFSTCSCNDLSDCSTAWLLSMPSMVSVKETHCVCATAIVLGALQQTTAIRPRNAGALPLLHNKKHDELSRDLRKSVTLTFERQHLRVLLCIVVRVL